MSTATLQDRLAGTWNFNPVHSSASFSIKYLVATFSGRFDKLDATFADGKLSGSVPVDSISVKDENLGAHLRGPDFFDAEVNPEISFESSEISIGGDRVELEGELTLRGVTRPLHATGTVNGPTVDFMDNTRLGFVLETTIDRTAYGLDWNADLPKGGRALSNDVKLTVELEFHKG